MIKSFKIFENYGSTANTLADQFDSDYVEEWYKENNSYDVSEIISMSSTRDILNCFDDQEYKDDFVKGYVDSYEISEFDKDELKRYVEEHLDGKEDKILDVYNDNYYYGEDDITSDIDGVVSIKTMKDGNTKIIITPKTGKIKQYKVESDFHILVNEGEQVKIDEVLATGKSVEYDDNMLDDLAADELREVIEDSNEEYECTEWIIEGWYEGRDGEDILSEFHNIESMEASDLYDIISNYVDDDQILKNWEDGEDYSYKQERLEEEIHRNQGLQRYLIDKDPDNASLLAELWEEEGSSGNDVIGDEYDFQKAYIQKYIKENADDEEIKDEEYVGTLIEDALEYLHDNFGVDDAIEKEYYPHMWKITAKSKYNL